MVALKDLSQEAIWFDKYKYEDAERRYYEKLAKGGSSSGDAPASAPQSQSFLASEIARARQQIKNSLECGDSESAIMPLSTELSSKVTTLEKENTGMKNVINNLELLIKKLDSRVMALEARLRDSDPGSSPAKASDLKTKESQPSRNEEEDDDDDIDLFGSDEDEEANRIREERLQAYAAKKEKKPAVIAKSSVVLDVKPWDDETDMKTAEEKVREISMEGLTWGAAKLIPLAYGIKKLQIMCTVVDDLVSVEELSEKIEAIEDFVQSVDVAAFNKI